MIQPLVLAFAVVAPSALEDLNDAKIELSDFKNADLRELEGLVAKAHADEPKDGARFLPGTGWRPEPSSLLQKPSLHDKLNDQRHALENIVHHIGSIDAMSGMPLPHAATHAQSHGHVHRHGQAHGHGHANKIHKRHSAAHEAAHKELQTSLLEAGHGHPNAEMEHRIQTENTNIQAIMQKLKQDWKDAKTEEAQQDSYESSKASPSSFLEEQPVKQIEWYDQRKQDDFQRKDVGLAKDEARLAQISARLHAAHQKVDKDLVDEKNAEKDHPHSKIYERLRDIVNGKARPEHLRLHD